MVTLHRVSDVDDLISQAALKFVDTVARIQAAGGGLHHDGVCLLYTSPSPRDS